MISFVLNSLLKGSGATVSSGHKKSAIVPSGHKICIEVHIFSQWLTGVPSGYNVNIEARLSSQKENIPKKAFWI